MPFSIAALIFSAAPLADLCLFKLLSKDVGINYISSAVFLYNFLLDRFFV